MKKVLVFIICLFVILPSSAKEKSFLTFQKINSGHQVKVPLPLKCRIYTGKTEKRFGTILSVTEEAVQFEVKEYDTAEVTAILAIDSLSRKEKYDLVESLIEESKCMKDVPIDSILKISVLSGHDRKTRELLVLASALGFMGSSLIFTISLSNHVGTGLTKWNWIELAGVGTSAAAMGVLIKRNFEMDKWEIKSSVENK